MSSPSCSIPFSSFLDGNGISRITGMKAGPFPVGVTTEHFFDEKRVDPGDTTRPRGLQTEIWYPATDESTSAPRNLYSNYIGANNCADPEKAIELANLPTAIGGYREKITISELDDATKSTWMNDAVRDAEPRKEGKWPLVLFSHGSGAYRASYLYWCEFLASQGFVVAAPDHPGSSRYTIVDGRVILPGGNRSKRDVMERERPLDMITIMDGIERLSNSKDSKFSDKVDCTNVAISGMSFGGYTVAETMELQDPRIKAAVMKCPSLNMSGKAAFPNRDLLYEPSRTNKQTPVLMMIAVEDTVIGQSGYDAAHAYLHNHIGPSYLFEIVRGGHVSFTSCEMYDPNYGNGIGTTNPCNSLTQPGTTYQPLDIQQQHAMINSYGLAFLNTYLRSDSTKAYPGLKDSIDTYNESYLQSNHFAGELNYRVVGKMK